MTEQTRRQVREALEYAQLIWSRYRDHGDAKDLKAATGTYRRILGNPDVVAELPNEAQAARANLALALIDVFALTNEIRHLDESIDLSTAALTHEPDGVGRLSLLNTRHVARLKRFVTTHQQADLDDAAAAVDEMVRLAPTDGTTVMNHAAILMQRFDATGSLEALDAAIDDYSRCADIERPAQRAAALGSLADALVERYRLRGRAEDIDRAYTAETQTIDLLRPDSPQRGAHLLVLGNILLAQYDARKDPALLDAAIDRFDAAIGPGVTPSAELLQNVGYARILRYLRARDEHDLDLGILAVQQAIGGAGDEWRVSSGRLVNLALGLAERWRLHHADADLDLARGCFRAAASSSEPQIALDAAFDWAALERDAQNWPGAHTAYQLALDAAERLLESNAARESREVWLYESRGLGPRAAYAAARCGDWQAAVLAIERSRAVLWTHALRLHATGGAMEPRRDDEISNAVTVPTVYLAAADEGGVALIVTPSGLTRTIEACWLPDLTDTVVRERLRGPDGSKSLAGYLGAYAMWQAADDVASEGAADTWASMLDDLLRWCWTAAIGPVLDALPTSIDRIVMIAAGPLGFVPLHAAWTDDRARPTGRRYALDRAAFVYAPNATALAAAERSIDTRKLGGLLAVENPSASSDLDLPTAAFEVAAARRRFAAATVLRGDDADRSHVVQALPDASVVHLCCHGRAEIGSPLTSGVQLAGGDFLTLGDLLRLQLPRCRLVLLSGCETAVAGIRLPDEVVSLQSALLQAGAAAAIATSWSIYDTSATLVVARFYEAWRGEPAHDPPQALRMAQQWVRDSSNEEKREQLTSDAAMIPLAADLLADIDAAIVADGPEGRSFAGPLHWAAFNYAGV